MAVNTLEMAQLFQTQLDRQIIQDATSNFLEMNAGQVQYNGGDTVKIPTISMDGMGDYDRANGYVDGSVTLKYDSYQMTQDRGRAFNLDAMDVNESNFIATAGNVMGEFQRLKVIPEIDSYRWSTIFQTAKKISGHVTEYTPAKADILDALDDDIQKVEDKAGSRNGLVIVMNTLTSGILNKAIDKRLDPVTFTSGQIHTEVLGYNDIPIIKVSSDRMKSLYTKYDGKTEGQEKGGIVPADNAVQINWLIFPQFAPIAVSKMDTIRIFDPATYQKATAWHIDYRRFHDIWIPKQRLEVIYANAVKATP